MHPLAASPAGVTHSLCAFIAGARARGLAPEIVHMTERAFANWLACALAAVEDEAVVAVLDTARALSGREQATLIGRSERLDIVNASLVNGVAGNALDYDDMHVPTLIHPTGPVVPGALALAEHLHASGEVLVRAIATGIEIECRLGHAWFPSHYDSGWHSTATLGTLGSVAAAAVLLDLNHNQTQHAFGIAATQASGLRAMLPNACKSFNVGKAAAAGVLAAMLARSGLASATDVLEGEFGLFSVFGEPADRSSLTAHLGEHYLITEISLKPYPCGVVIHPLIDAALALARTDGFDVARMTAIIAEVHPRAIALADRQHPQTAITARFSLQHAVAIALHERAAGRAEFDSVDVHAPAVRAIRDRIRLQASDAIAPAQARLRIELDNGERLEHFTHAPSGSPARPLADAELEAKFFSLARPTIKQAAAAALYEQCMHLAALADCASLRHTWARAAR